MITHRSDRSVRVTPKKKKKMRLISPPQTCFDKKRDLYQKVQEIKGKVKPRLGRLNYQQGSTLSDRKNKEKVETIYWKSIQKRQKADRYLWRRFLWGRTCNPRKRSESCPKAQGKNNPMRVVGIPKELLQATESEPVKTLRWIYRQIWKRKQWLTAWRR